LKSKALFAKSTMAKGWRWREQPDCRVRQIAVREMKGHGSKFGRKHEEAIAALLTQRNIDEAANAVGIAPNTMLKWMKQPEFDTAYRAARRKAFGQSIARLQQGSSAAATTLLKLLIDQGTPASVRARVADSIFNHAAKAIEIEDIEARVAALEAAANNRQQG
jgi:transposase-like protein